MTDILLPGQGILFMKVGVHAQENLESIIARKTKEIDDAGYALWGYGGSTCYPTSMVQPFAKEQAALGKSIFLCMQEMNSKHFAEPLRAEQFSVNGVDWEAIPNQINVRGSRFALAIKALHKEEFVLPLAKTKVAVGNSKGSLGSRYIRGQVDKACLAFTDAALMPPEPDDITVEISLVAELCEPYAVFLK